MAARLFEGKGHAAVYKKYRFSPPQNLQEVIISYLEKKFREQTLKYASNKIRHVEDYYKVIFDALPFQDKERITDIFATVPSTVSGLLGIFQTFSMYQTFLEAEPEAAKSLLQNTRKRTLEVMGVSFLETPVEIKLQHVCVLGYKNF